MLVLTSYRRKFKFQVRNGPEIEFSADVAEAHIADPGQLAELGIKPTADTGTVCSFEFGLGHPGVGGTATGLVPLPDLGGPTSRPRA